MKFSAAGEYALFAVLDLALHTDEGHTRGRVICARQDIPRRMISRLMWRLKAAGHVESVRGPHGGYRLARPPSEITVLQVLQAVEGPIATLRCTGEEGETLCFQHKSGEAFFNCVVREVWLNIRHSIVEMLASTTVSELCQRTVRKTAHCAPMTPFTRGGRGAGLASSFSEAIAKN